MRKHIINRERTWGVFLIQIHSSANSPSFPKNKPRNLCSLASALPVYPKIDLFPHSSLSLVLSLKLSFPRKPPQNPKKNLLLSPSYLALQAKENTPSKYLTSLCQQNTLLHSNGLQFFSRIFHDTCRHSIASSIHYYDSLATSQDDMWSPRIVTRGKISYRKCMKMSPKMGLHFYKKQYFLHFILSFFFFFCSNHKIFKPN